MHEMPSAAGTPPTLSRYRNAIRKFPILTAEDERELVRRWRDHGDAEAAHALVTSHLRLVAKIAAGFRGYGLPIDELIAEGNVGMMQAVKRFDHDRGFRLATYAMWWIRAAMQEYILRSWSLVKMGTTAAQKKLFFNLRRLKSQVQAIDDGDMAPEHVAAIAAALDVSEDDVVSMNRRLACPDHSLNARLVDAGDGEWQDTLVDDIDGQDVQLGEREEREIRRALLRQAFHSLSAIERTVVAERWLRDDPITLRRLGRLHNLSTERVRQIEVTAFKKLRRRLMVAGAERRSGMPAARHVA